MKAKTYNRILQDATKRFDNTKKHMKTKYFTTFHVIWNNGLYEEIGDGMYAYPKRTKLYKQCELLFNQNKIISFGYERAFQFN